MRRWLLALLLTGCTTATATTTTTTIDCDEPRESYESAGEARSPAGDAPFGYYLVSVQAVAVELFPDCFTPAERIGAEAVFRAWGK